MLRKFQGGYDSMLPCLYYHIDGTCASMRHMDLIVYDLPMARGWTFLTCCWMERIHVLKRRAHCDEQTSIDSVLDWTVKWKSVFILLVFQQCCIPSFSTPPLDARQASRHQPQPPSTPPPTDSAIATWSSSSPINSDYPLHPPITQRSSLGN